MKGSVMERDGFFSIIKYSQEDRIFHGKIEGINDIISFEGKNVDELEIAFKEAIEDYLEICKKLNKEPLKSYNGTFNVRIKPEMHKEAVYQAKISGYSSLNSFIEEAVEEKIKKKEKELSHS